MERVTVKNFRDKTLVGLLYPACSDKIVIMAPGSCCDKSSEGRFEFCARSLNEVGISAFTIDFSGCGESEDESLTVAKEIDDLKAVISWVEKRGYSHIGLFGHSLGGLVSLLAWSSKIKTIVMMGGVTGPLNIDWSKRLTPEQQQERFMTGNVTLKKLQNMTRKTIILDKDFFGEFDKINQAGMLENVKCSVLMIHGDGDEEERSFLELSQKGWQYLPGEAEIKILPGATHGFWGYMKEVADLSTAWFLKHLSC